MRRRRNTFENSGGDIPGGTVSQTGVVQLSRSRPRSFKGGDHTWRDEGVRGEEICDGDKTHGRRKNRMNRETRR